MMPDPTPMPDPRTVNFTVEYLPGGWLRATGSDGRTVLISRSGDGR